MAEKEPIESSLSHIAQLRTNAEKRVRVDLPSPSLPLAEAEVRALVHELQVHQIELEMQNEELQRARKAAEVALDNYCDLFDFAPVGCFFWNHEGRTVEVNLAGAALLGRPRQAVVQKRFGQFVASADLIRFAEFRKLVLTHNTEQSCEVKLLNDGGTVDVLIKGIATRDRQGRGQICRAAIIDITERKCVAELAAQKAAAEQANRAKDHFLAILSHELRTPLTPVVMGLSMLQDRTDIDPSIRETLEMVRRNVEMESRLIDDLLDISRIARGKVALTRSAVELSTVIRRAVEVCMPGIEERGLHFGADFGSAGPYWVEADISRLQQVFWNLLKNAIKFTPRGGSIDVRCKQSEKDVVVEVIDSGIGIEPDALLRIFSAFEQEERSITQQFGGLGLGLAISKTLVELHGGQIEAHSEGRGKGANFLVRLPLTAPPLQADSRLVDPHQNRATRPLRVLLVEDHIVTAKLMRMVLTSDGHNVKSAHDVATALDLADHHSFDLLVSDLGLPDGSGHDLMRQLRQHGHTFPGIALSGYGQDEDVKRSHEAGFSAHLTKPASHAAVSKAIESIAAAVAPTGNCPASEE